MLSQNEISETTVPYMINMKQNDSNGNNNTSINKNYHLHNCH